MRLLNNPSSAIVVYKRLQIRIIIDVLKKEGLFIIS
jgi:hypothetical protein